MNKKIWSDHEIEVWNSPEFQESLSEYMFLLDGEYSTQDRENIKDQYLEEYVETLKKWKE